MAVGCEKCCVVMHICLCVVVLCIAVLLIKLWCASRQWMQENHQCNLCLLIRRSMMIVCDLSVCLTHTHANDFTDLLPPADVFLHAGDFTHLGLPREVEEFNEFLGTYL